MSETAVMALPVPDTTAASTPQTMPRDSVLDIGTASPNEDTKTDSSLGQKAVKTFHIRQSSCSAEVREVHCDGLQPYQILRKAVKPDRPMITILDLPSKNIVAGTKAGRRECHHIFVGNPELGATVWLPVTHSTSGWTFNAVDRVVEWRGVGRTEDLHGDMFELVELVSSEVLAKCHEGIGGVVLSLYVHMEQPLILLVLASMMAILERRRTQDPKDDGGNCLPEISGLPPAESSRS